MIRVEGHKNLYRDEKSGAIINNDSTGYTQYKKISFFTTFNTKT